MKHVFHVALLLGITAVTSAARAEDRFPASTPFPLGIVEGTGKVAYVMNTAKGIDAVSLDTGKTLWHTETGQFPLAAIGDQRLYALAAGGHTAHLLAFDANGKKTLESAEIVFEDWVGVGGWRDTFAVDGMVDENHFVLSYEAHASYSGGAAPSPEMLARTRHDALGQFDIVLPSGAVQPVALKEEIKAQIKVPAISTKAVKLGEITYALVLLPVDRPQGLGHPRELTATDAAGKILWRHPVAPEVVRSPPP